MNLEITKMLTISTAHISEETNQLLLDEEVDVTCFGLDEYGWLILSYGPEENLPEDLAACLKFADDHGCAWLRLDSDGMIVDGLEVFDW